MYQAVNVVPAHGHISGACPSCADCRMLQGASRETTRQLGVEAMLTNQGVDGKQAHVAECWHKRQHGHDATEYDCPVPAISAHNDSHNCCWC